MTTQVKAVFDAALALAEADRVLLAECLLETVPAEQDELTDDELYAELERRRADFERDPSEAVPWSELLKEE
jgi:putative addiction module component (TIGR02574 family)